MIYLALAALSSLIALNLWRNIRSFRIAAREVREGRGRDRPFASRSIAPEFAGVAADFDSLVDDLRTTARDIRQEAEDNAHSFKAPLATIEAATENLKRRLAPAEPRVARTIELMSGSIERLKALISAVERYGYVTADLIEAPRTSVDLVEVVGGVLLRYQDVLSERSLRLKRRLVTHATVRASKSMLEIAVENLIDNAISFSPPRGIIEVTLTRRDSLIELRVDDEGPGVDPAKIERIFERYFSLRDHQPKDNGADDEEFHSGLGLWMVRRNVEAFGGTVFAVGRPSGGLSVCATFPGSIVIAMPALALSQPLRTRRGVDDIVNVFVPKRARNQWSTGGVECKWDEINREPSTRDSSCRPRWWRWLRSCSSSG